jgi:hypothetical protein
MTESDWRQEFAGRSQPELLEILLEALHSSSLAIQRGAASHCFRTRSKPLLGGVFGLAGFHLSSVTMDTTGLDDTWYFVAHECGLMVGRGDTRAEALKHAREILAKVSATRLHRAFDAFSAELDKALEADAEQQRLDRNEWLLQRRAALPDRQERAAVKSIPRRRRQIFEESKGKCHYCATELTLDGVWHIEHKFPKALGGGNERSNLVAACVRCNHAKRDRTDIEFKAAQATQA